MSFNDDLIPPSSFEELEGLEIEVSNTQHDQNNPLGLSDKDLQLQYDESYPKSPGISATSAAEEHSEGEEPSQPISVPYSPSAKVADDKSDDLEKNEDEPQTSGDAAQIPDASDLFGSDHSDDEDGDQAGNMEKDPTTPLAQGEDDDGAGSVTGSIKSDDGDRKLSDFDIMMLKKSEERRQSYKRRKRQDVDLISDHDDRILGIIKDMKTAAENDRHCNQRGECAVNKLSMLPRVMNQLHKHDLQTAFLDLGVLAALADWLAPLPDGNLTHLRIRESVLKLLAEMTSITPEQLKNSGIGKAVMLLYKHPKEMKENRQKAGKLIQEWSRPIFGTSTNYRSMSREEREERDMEFLTTKRRLSLEAGGDSPAAGGSSKKRRGGGSSSKNAAVEEEEEKEIPRARVPQPSMKDYVIRPKSQVSMETEGGRRSGSGAKPQNRFERRIRGMKEQQRSAKNAKGHVSLEGRKM